MAKRTKETITLGSGKIYISEYVDTIPAIEDICIDENLLGAVSGGATYEYKGTFYEAKDDSGAYVKTILTDEEATLKSGIMTWNAVTLSKLVSTATVTEDATTALRTLSIGGLANYNGKSYVIVFAYTDETDGNSWLIIRGQNQAGFSLAYAKDKETIVDAEFKCLPMDSTGVLTKYVEQYTVPQAETEEAEG